MSILAMTPDGDLDFSGGNLTVVQDENTCIAQELTNRFQLFEGEWFMDSRIGVPYYKFVYVKNPDLQAIGQLFKRVIMQVPGVQQILQARLDFFNRQRQLDAFFKIQTTSGAIITGGPGAAFIVEINGPTQ